MTEKKKILPGLMNAEKNRTPLRLPPWLNFVPGITILMDEYKPIKKLSYITNTRNDDEGFDF